MHRHRGKELKEKRRHRRRADKNGFNAAKQ